MDVDQTTHNGILDIISSFFTEVDSLGGTITLVLRARKYSGFICTPKVQYEYKNVKRQFRLTEHNWQLDIPETERACVYHMLCAVEHTRMLSWRVLFKKEISAHSAKLQLSEKQYQCLYYRNLMNREDYTESKDHVCTLRTRFLAL